MRTKRALLGLLFVASAQVVLAADHPVRVFRDAGGPHFFQVWNPSLGDYEHVVLRGAASFDFAGPNDNVSIDYPALFAGLRGQGMNFVRMWMRPSDGKFSSNFDGSIGDGRVVLANENTLFTDRLRAILEAASKNPNGVVDNGLIVEVMLWDTSTQWHEADLQAPTSWATCFSGAPENCPNIHHPNNHIKSLTDPVEIGGLNYGSVEKLEGSGSEFWFNTNNTEWMAAQRDYMTQIMNVVSQFDNVTLDVINEAGRDNVDGSVDWRTATHAWLAQNWPGFVYQSQSYGGDGAATPRIASDEAVRAFGAQNPAAVSMVSTHWLWTYDHAQDVYHQYGVLAGCNEGDFPGGTTEFQVKQTAWGITMGGGAFRAEELWPGHPNGPWGDLGPRLMAAMGRFFEPVNDPDSPAFWTMSPQKGMVDENVGQSGTNVTHYVLANGTADILIMSENDTAFHVSGLGAHRYRWFTFNGSEYVWGNWSVKDVDEFSPSGGDWVGLQIKPFDDFPTVSIDSASVNFAVSEAGPASVRINRSGELNLTSTVHFSTTPGTAASPTDFTSVSQEVVFAPGESVQWVTVSIAGDTMDEPDEAFTVTLSSTSQSEVGSAQGTVTIQDDDNPPSLSINNVTVAEGNGTDPANSTKVAIFTVTLSAASGWDVSVGYATQDALPPSGALAGFDYQAVPTSPVPRLFFPAGQTQASISVPIMDDLSAEDAETFLVPLLTAVPNAPEHAVILGAGQGIGTITNDDILPTTLTGASTSLTDWTATLNGNVNPAGRVTAAFYQYGPTLSYGMTTPAVGTGWGVVSVAFSSPVANLACNTLVHFRAAGTNSAGTSYGADATFTTLACNPPTVTTGALTRITQTGATLSGTITPNGGYTRWHFEYGPTIPYGSSSQNVWIPFGTPGSLGVNLVVKGLACNTLHHYRAVAQNGAELVNGSDNTFTTAACPSVGSNNISSTTARSIPVNSTSGDMLDPFRTEIWYRVRLFANRSYLISALTVNEDGGAALDPITLELFLSAGNTMTPVTGVLVANAEGAPDGPPALSQSLSLKPSFQPSNPTTTSGTYLIKVLGSPAVMDTSVNMLVRETTLLSPWAGGGTGYDAFHEIHNNTDQAVEVTLRAFGPTETQIGVTLDFTVPANATVYKTSVADLQVPVGVSGGTVLTHSGAFGAISANTTTLSTTTGLSFDSPFTPRNGTMLGRPVR